MASPSRPWILRYFYDDLLLPDDDFFMKTRKIVLALMVAPCTLFLMFSLKSMFDASKDNAPLAWMTAIATFMAGLIPLACWAFAKKTRTATDAMMDTWCFSLEGAVLLCVLGVKGYPYEPVFLSGGLVIVMMQTRMTLLHLTLCAMGFFLVMYDQSFAAWGYQPLIIPGESYAVSFADVIIRQLIAAVVSIAGIGVVTLMKSEFQRTLHATQVGLNMASEVSDHLVAYDTANALSVLDRDRDNVDPKLVKSFTQITKNMELYRSHLPNYILGLGDAWEDDESTESVEEEEAVDFAEPRNIFASRERRVMVSETIVMSEIVLCTFAMIHFRAEDVDMSPFVDRVHGLARGTNASVHGFMGDTLNVTWNAGRRVIQHEIKGALFMLQLQKDTGTASVVVGGALSSGLGRHQIAGGELQAALLRVEWLPRLRTLFALAAANHSLLMCSRTDDAARFHVESRLVDIVALGDETLDVIEMLREHASDIGEEWLYTLEDSGALEDSKTDLVSLAVEACRREEYAQARVFLEGLPDTAWSPMVHRLEEKIRKCVGNHFVSKHEQEGPNAMPP